jgi:hypothetical protein
MKQVNSMTQIMHVVLFSCDSADVIAFGQILDKTGILFKLQIERSLEKLPQVLASTELSGQARPHILLIDITALHDASLLASALNANRRGDRKIYLMYRDEHEIASLKISTRTVSGVIKKPIPVTGQTPSDIFNLIIDLKNLGG